MIKSTLSNLGLGSKEIAVYLALLERGKASAVDISRETNINRTTVYSVVKQLIELGIIAEDTSTKKNMFIALPPEDLRNILNPIRKELDEKSHVVEQAVVELSALVKEKQIHIPKVSFVPENDIVDYLKLATPRWEESCFETETDSIGFEDKTFPEVFDGWLEYHWTEKQTIKSKLRLLTNDGDSKNKFLKEVNEKDRHIKFWNSGSDITYTTWIKGNYVIFINTRTKPYYLIEINDAHMAANQRQLFESIWKTLS